MLCCYSEYVIRMQLRFGLCELCRSVLFRQPSIVSVAKFHLHPALSANARAAIKEKHSGSEESPKQVKKVLHISCKRKEYNLYKGFTYGKFENIPLASKGWHHRKSKGDFFTIQKYKENPAISDSSETSVTFADTGINSNIIGVLEEQEITEPTVIQKDGIPTILEGHNTLLTAETGCGKTLAYLLPMIQQILIWQRLLTENRFNSPLGVIVSPNRELAIQIGKVAEKFASKLMFNTQVLTGGHTKRKMLNPSYEQVDLLVASLGALSKLTTTGIYSMKNVRHVVLDEADTLLDDSFNEKLCHFLKRFHFQFKGTNILTSVPPGVQLTLVSATLPTSLPDVLSSVIETESLLRVTSNQVHRILPHVPQKFYRLGRSQKPVQLLTMVKQDVVKKHPVIIFSNKAPTCDWISMFLNENGVKCVNLNGKMPFDIRTGKLNSFLLGDVDVISCTDIGSRGIDTIRVKHVINYDFPLYMADYIHRCGRTGRVGSDEGSRVSNLIVSSREVELVQKIETAARKMDALPNVNGNITRTIKYRILKNLEKESF
ncbi:probable ATP-dependent RNA helicase DDX28 isoform X2 [Zootermopsis nevadensis]|uniref:RNA helicase n=1 Tax=Zootermopsis nevadensis TaxID=136037 RepID=A0A067RK13_ZOONE|nr:probable ATP-dependent RNA helicase DDX28 isoform X2 [Zootermopsis nevadensis]KDR24181.1 putative ATP-dependent RNA helicase DDX28 [Zootermopsis nevadensis]